MFTMIKFSLSFCLSFLLLSVPLNQKPLFFYLDRWAKPFTDRVFKHSQVVFWESVQDGKKFGQKIFFNNLPDQEKKQDRVRVKSSATARSKESRQINDDYTEEEKNMLSRILKEESQSP